MKLQIEVTQTDIDKGCVCSPCHCPIARAIERELKLDCVSVGAREVFLDVPPFRYTLPPEATSFILKFDDWQTVEPFSFTLIAK